MQSTVLWGANDQGWGRDEGAIIVNTPLKEVLMLHDRWGIFVQPFLDMLNHGYFYIRKGRASEFLRIGGKQGNTLELMKYLFVGYNSRSMVLYLKMQSSLTVILSLQLSPLGVEFVVPWNCPLKGNGFSETHNLLHYCINL